MRIFSDPAEAGRALPGAWVAVGNFDGLHVGHRRVVAEACARAKAAGAPALLMSFRPHPAAVLTGRTMPPLLLSDAQRDEILASWGLDGLLLQPFDDALSALSPQAFVARVLRDALRVKGVVVGDAFRFGNDRAGDLAVLQAELESFGASATGVPAACVGGEVVSSSRIRALVADGRDAEAAELLGRCFALEGTVVEGDRRGRTLGFPTANVDAPGRSLPGRGVHACIAARGGDTWAAVANVGVRPTFGDGRNTVEVHVLGEPGDLYGSTLRVAFVAKLRDERPFGSRDALIGQIRRDCEDARRVLAGRPPAAWRCPGF